MQLMTPTQIMMNARIPIQKGKNQKYTVNFRLRKTKFQHCFHILERGDESDYYTPEEPGPTQSGPLYDNNAVCSSIESTPQRLPGTPLSHASVRSSGDSYTSGSSTRHLLAVANNISNSSSERAVQI